MTRLHPTLWAAILAGCAAEETTPRERDERDVFALELATFICESSATCCSDKSLRAPSDICISTQRNDAYIQFIRAERDRRIIDLTAADGCLARYRAEWSCDGIRLAEELPSYCPELFTDIPEGGLAPGEPCTSNAECSSPGSGSRFCRFAESVDGGTCAWLLPTQYGDPCADTEVGVFHVCEEGSTCVPPLGDPTGIRTCGPPGALGDPCFDRFGCAETYACATDAEGTLRCQEAIPDGGHCINRIDACGPKSFCDTATDACKVLPIFDECAGGSCASYEFDKVCR